MVKNYHVDNVTIEEILGWIKQGKIDCQKCNVHLFGPQQRLEI